MNGRRKVTKTTGITAAILTALPMLVLGKRNQPVEHLVPSAHSGKPFDLAELVHDLQSISDLRAQRPPNDELALPAQPTNFPKLSDIIDSDGENRFCRPYGRFQILSE